MRELIEKMNSRGTENSLFERVASEYGDGHELQWGEVDGEKVLLVISEGKVKEGFKMVFGKLVKIGKAVAKGAKKIGKAVAADMNAPSYRDQREPSKPKPQMKARGMAQFGR